MIEPTKTGSEREKLTWWMVLAPLVVMTIIFFVSSRSTLPDLDGNRGLQNIAGHFTVYAALGFTLSLLFHALGWGTWRVWLVAIVLATLYGLSDEFHQSFVPNRSVEGKDVLTDFLGAITGATLLLWGISHRSGASATSDVAPTPPEGGSS